MEDDFDTCLGTLINAASNLISLDEIIDSLDHYIILLEEQRLANFQLVEG